MRGDEQGALEGRASAQQKTTKNAASHRITDKTHGFALLADPVIDLAEQFVPATFETTCLTMPRKVDAGAAKALLDECVAQSSPLRAVGKKPV